MLLFGLILADYLAIYNVDFARMLRDGFVEDAVAWKVGRENAQSEQEQAKRPLFKPTSPGWRTTLPFPTPVPSPMK